MTTVEDILMVKGPDVIALCPSQTVRQASKLMAEANVGSVIIRDAGEVVGIFTERDLLRRVVAPGKNPDSLMLADVMSAPVQSCGLADDPVLCARRLAEGHIRHLAVMEDGALVGIIGLRDILSHQASGELRLPKT